MAGARRIFRKPLEGPKMLEEYCYFLKVSNVMHSNLQKAGSNLYALPAWNCQLLSTVNNVI